MRDRSRGSRPMVAIRDGYQKVLLSCWGARGGAARTCSPRRWGLSTRPECSAAVGGCRSHARSRGVGPWIPARPDRRGCRGTLPHAAPEGVGRTPRFPGRSPLGKAQTGGAGSAPTMQRRADGQADTWAARPGWWGCAVRGRVRARPAPPSHVGTEERSTCTAAVAPDLAWNTSPRRSDPHPSTLPHHNGPGPPARRPAPPSPPRGRVSRYARPYPARPELGATPSGYGRGLQAGGQPPLAEWSRYARPSPPGVRGAEYALASPLEPGCRSTLTGCAWGPKTVHVSPPMALGGHGWALRTGRSSRPPPFVGGIPPVSRAGLGSPRLTQPRITPPPLRTCIERARPAVCRAPTAPGPGLRSAGRRFQAVELLENSGRALTPAT
ncbi:hypothetical protein SAMN05421803_1272 [Nocardiopsis flavescens]|uniref:Uncharacterized protein n=1 Tax=Nocardiopsis flavescens TaxID=758803 RepID=A0A1M6UAA5_9ACTN|nr:hypothetical protein SAMN05421803_1272 [Nocardiopsis flavescens]